MATQSLLLKLPLQWKIRQWRQGLLHFFEAVTLYLEAGYDLAYAWPEALLAIGDELPPSLRHALEPAKEEGLSATLTRLNLTFDIIEQRLWFGVLAELYSRGASLVDGVQCLAGQLRREQERALEEHLRDLPSRASILLILFFLPPTFLLLFSPLLHQLLRSLN